MPGHLHALGERFGQGDGHVGLSQSQVSRLCEEIDGKVKAFRTRPLEGDWPYLWIEATYLKVRRGGRIGRADPDLASVWSIARWRTRHDSNVRPLPSEQFNLPFDALRWVSLRCVMLL